MIKKQYSPDGDSCNITFSILPEQAAERETAFIVGDFNRWDESASPMKKTKQGGFEVKIKLETGHEYHFRYLLDGKDWENDWNADKYIQSPYTGVDNSVVIV